jgi:hypothetical protein
MTSGASGGSIAIESDVRQWCDASRDERMTFDSDPNYFSGPFVSS